MFACKSNLKKISLQKMMIKGEKSVDDDGAKVDSILH